MVRKCWLACAAVFALVGCTAAVAGAKTNELADAATACEALWSADFSQVIDAPTEITAAHLIAENAGSPAYCKVQGYVNPNVGFEIWLPALNWNGKFLGVGCGGFCGQIAFYLRNCEGPLRRGYACVASNLGHTGEGGVWAYNNLQAKIDWGYRATHVVALAGKAITERYYRKAPKYSYFMGCSKGGNQGLMEAQRFPWDFNGIAVGAPGLPMGNAFLSVLWDNMSNVGRDGTSILKPDDVKLLHNAVLMKCDMDDGVKDGIVSNPTGCRFDPSELACKSGKNTQCLTEEKIQAVRKLYAGPKTSKGESIHPGNSVGSELNWIGNNVAGDGGVPPELGFGADYFKYMAFNPAPGPSWKPSDFNVDEDYKRFGIMDAITNSNNPDLRQFKKEGGKIIAYHSWADPMSIPQTLIDYFKTVEDTMGGAEKTKDFFRLFVLPGMDHCTGGVGAYAVDYLSYLEAWVERGEAPDQLLSARPKGAVDINNFESRYPAPIFPLAPSDVEFTRPVYQYPAWAKYKGTGDPNRAENFMPIQSR